MQLDENESVTVEEMKSLIFSNPSRTLLSESMQGMISKGSKWSNQYDWEQTWLCGAVTIPTLRNRHVGIARLKHRCNLGKNAEEVKFFILILCPAEIKQTKSALETAR